MQLENMPFTTEVALESEVDDLRNQLNEQRNIGFQMLRVLRTKFPEEFPEDGRETNPDNP